MKAMHAGLVGIALLGVAGPVALTHCSGSDSGTPMSPDGGGMSSGSSSGANGGTSGQGSGSSSGTPGSTGSASGSPGSGAASGTSSTGPVGEGGSGAASGASSGTGTVVTSPGPDGGAPSDPGMIACGSTSCNTSQTSCCQKTSDAGTSGECVPPNGACSGGTTLKCNEASDCANGLVCCDFFGSTSCAASCTAGGFQMCRVDSECGTNSDAGAAAQKCVLQTCGGTPTGRGGPPTPVTTIEACAVQAPPTRGGPPPRFDAGGPAPGTWGPLTGCTAK